MPKLHYRLTVPLGTLVQRHDDGFGAFSVMVTARPEGAHTPGEALLRHISDSYVVRVDWETLVKWECAEACAAPEDPSIDDSTVVGSVLEVGDSEDHRATTETGHAVVVVRMPIEEARRAADLIGCTVWITRWP